MQLGGDVLWSARAVGAYLSGDYRFGGDDGGWDASDVRADWETDGLEPHIGRSDAGGYAGIRFGTAEFRYGDGRIEAAVSWDF